MAAPFVDLFLGTHTSARFTGFIFTSGGHVEIRNNDNICSATIARGSRLFGMTKIWREFVSAVSRETPFSWAVDFFEKRGVTMTLSG